MGVPTLAELVVSSTPQEVLALELKIAATLGLPTSAWQPVQGVPALYNVNATIAADYSVTVAYLAQGGYASLAAQMVDANGNPVTTWMDLRGTDQYGEPRAAATFAIGSVPLLNNTGTSYPYGSTNPLHAKNLATGATYTSVGSGAVAPNATTNVTFQADVAGSSGTSGSGIFLALTTPLIGVNPQALPVSLVGADAETNATYLARCQAKLGNISPSGPIGAYDYIVQSIPQGVSSITPPYAVSSRITRSTTLSNPATGIVTVACANAAGPPPIGDMNVVNAVIQAKVTPLSVMSQAVPATLVSASVSYSVFIKSTTGLTAAQAITNINDALATLFANIPIGGYTSNVQGFTNYVPLALVSDTIMNSNPGTSDCLVSINGQINNLTLPSTGVAVLTVAGSQANFVP